MNYDINRSGAYIRQLRIQRGYTQEMLATELNIDRSLISHIEVGKRGCSVEVLVRLSNFFATMSSDEFKKGKHYQDNFSCIVLAFCYF